MKTMVNRRIVWTGLTMFGMQLALELGTSLMGLPWHAIMTLHLVVWGLAVTTLAMIVDRRFWLAGAVYVAAFLLACARPGVVWHMMSGANLVLLASFVVAWWRPRPKPAR